MLITNNHDLGATTLAAIYTDRWRIETFFRTLKQNLKIKTLVGTSANAVKVQVWTALFLTKMFYAIAKISRLIPSFSLNPNFEFLGKVLRVPSEKMVLFQLSSVKILPCF